MNFFLTFCKTRKKFDKYVKVNRIRNKVIIDIKNMIDEEHIDVNNEDSLYYFKVLVYRKIQTSIEKNKDIYYIPNFNNKDFQIDSLLKLATLTRPEDNFNLLLFHDEFVHHEQWLNFILDNMHNFDTSQLIKDY